MKCANCGTELKIMSGDMGFYRYCLYCGKKYKIQSPAQNSIKSISEGAQA